MPSIALTVALNYRTLLQMRLYLADDVISICIILYDIVILFFVWKEFKLNIYYSNKSYCWHLISWTIQLKAAFKSGSYANIVLLDRLVILFVTAKPHELSSIFLIKKNTLVDDIINVLRFLKCCNVKQKFTCLLSEINTVF